MINIKSYSDTDTADVDEFCHIETSSAYLTTWLYPFTFDVTEALFQWVEHGCVYRDVSAEVLMGIYHD